MRVLVTGAAGYIGSILVPALLARGAHVTALDTFARNDTALAANCANPNFEPVRGDARNKDLVHKLMAKADVIVPLAALVGAPLCEQDPIAAKTTNFDAVRLIVDAVSPDQVLLYPTTNSGYGVGQSDQFCTEETPLKPISLYGVTKVDAERAVLDSGRGATLRLATVFGMAPRMRVDLLVNDFTYRAVMDRAVVLFEGHFKRNYHPHPGRNEGVPACAGQLRIDARRGLQCGPVGCQFVEGRALRAHQIAGPGVCTLSAPIGEDPDKRDYIVFKRKARADRVRAPITRWMRASVSSSGRTG